MGDDERLTLQAMCWLASIISLLSLHLKGIRQSLEALEIDILQDKSTGFPVHGSIGVMLQSTSSSYVALQ